MPYQDPDPTDPMTLHGVACDTTDDTAVREMAACFIEEFLRIGFDADRVMRMFRTPAYAGPFMAYRALGERTVRAMVDDRSLLLRHRPSPPPQTASEGDGTIQLPVLD